MKTWIQKALASVTAMGVGAVMLGAVAKAQDAPIMTYGVDVVSDYVIRGADQYTRKYNKTGSEEEHPAFNVTPALQPWVTFFAQSGVSLNLWGSFAVADRADDNEKGFLGFSRDDEVDYTLAYDWSNKLGGFTAAIIYYTYLDPCYGTATPCNRNSAAGARTVSDVKLSWAMPFAKSVNPYVAYYTNETPGGWYAQAGISGGEKMIWAVVLDEVRQGPRALTGKIGYVMDSITLALSAAYRPNPELVGPYDKEGKYAVKGEEKTYPSTIAWLTFSYSGSVAAK